jgi:hypothetical protein
MKGLICKIFGHTKNPVMVRFTSLKRAHIYCIRCDKRLQTNIIFIGERNYKI